MTSHSTWMLISTTFRYLHDIPYRPAALGGLEQAQFMCSVRSPISPGRLKVFVATLER
jgi:hypothetical protein